MGNVIVPATPAGRPQRGGLHEKCAVVAVMDPDAAGLTARALSVMDHRGSDSSGIGGISRKGSHELFRQPGPAHQTYTPAMIARLQTLRLTAAIGHNRYATSGPADKHHQPVDVGKGNKRIYFAQNGNLSNLGPLRAYLAEYGIDGALLNDTEMAAHAFAAQIARGATMAQAAAAIFPRLVGAHCTVVCGKRADGTPELAAFRDACGVRPLVLGKTAGGYIVTSETVGLDAAGAEFIREVQPGELIIINRDGLESHQLAEPSPRFDLLELIYFSHPNSLFKGVRISAIREAWGAQLAKEFGEVHPDTLVVGMPSSGLPYAKGFAAQLGLEFRPEAVTKLVRARSFMQPTQVEREAIRGRKYQPDTAIIKGRRTVAADDSIVRGTTTPYATMQLREAGATHVSWAIGSPTILYPNFYGIDLARQEELMAARHNNDIGRIGRAIGCDQLVHLRLEGMLQVLTKLTGEPADHFETSCFDGRYPIDIGERAIRTITHNSQKQPSLV